LLFKHFINLWARKWAEKKNRREPQRRRNYKIDNNDLRNSLGSQEFPGILPKSQ